MSEEFMGVCKTQTNVKSFKKYGLNNVLGGTEDDVLFE
jgi:hypothetical protein